MESAYLAGHFGGFALRLSWLPRLVSHYGPSGRVPSDLEAIACELGIGKNMAKALRAWGRAARLLHADGRIAEIGKRLFGTLDPYLERRQSIALLHWLIASNPFGFTAAAWLFNYNRRDTFTVDRAVSAFRDYLMSGGSTYAPGTLRSDMEPVLRMHGGLPDRREDETDDRFFSQLRLLSTKRDGRTTVFARTWEHDRPYLSDGLLLYALVQSLTHRKTASVALSSLHMGKIHQTAPGAVFGLSRDGFFSRIEHLARDSSASISLSALPGEDAMLIVTGELADACSRGDLATIDQRLFTEAV